MSSTSAIALAVATAIASNRDTAMSAAHITQVQNLRKRTLADNHVFVPTDGVAMESFEHTPKRNQGFSAATGVNAADLIQGLRDLNMPERHLQSVATECLNQMDGKYKIGDLLRESNDSTNYSPLSAIVGGQAAAQFSTSSGDVGLEAFGSDSDRIAADARVSIDLAIMRPFDNPMDKGLARVTQDSPVITIKIPVSTAYDWSKTQEANSTSESRNGIGNSYPVRDLFRNPTPVNTQAKRIVPVAASDVRGVLFTDNLAYKSGLSFNALDISRDPGKFGYDKIDKSDVIADGGQIDYLIVSVKSSSTTEYFKIPTKAIALSRFLAKPATRSSGERIASFKAVLPISADSKMSNGTTTTIFAGVTDASFIVTLQVNIDLNVTTGDMMGSGAASVAVVAKPGQTVGATTTTLYNGLTVAFAAFNPDIRFSEENMRKANLSVMTQYTQQQFEVPRSRVIFSEFALEQQLDENTIATTSSVVSLGNGRRGLDVITSALADVADALKFADTHPEIAKYNDLDGTSMVSSLVKPTVVTATIDYNDEQVNTMNESTRLVEIHGRARARLLAMVAQLMAKSQMLTQYKGGEVPVFKCWMHSVIADVVFGIDDYHPDLKDAVRIASGADYSMVLPNGYRLDIIKSNMDCLMKRVFILPVIESQMDSLITAAQIRDCGMITTNYSPTLGSATTRRLATVSREVVMVSNKVGAVLEIDGLQDQLGDVGYDAIRLNIDSSESLSY